MVATEALLPSMPATMAAAPATCGLAMEVPLRGTTPTPIASDKPSKDMKLSVKPHNQTPINAAMTEVGKLNPVIKVERQEFRKA